jgi:gas vesicle protein
MNKSTKRIALGAIIAAAGGYLAGILTAPKSGKETRGDIKDAAVATTAELEKRLKALHTELDNLLAQAKKQSNNLSGKAKDEVDKVVKTANVSKQKARELLSAIHEGDAEDKDLQKAIKDSLTAIDHLKAYLKK